MNAILKDKSKELLLLCEKYEIEKLYAFGSATTSKFDPKRSDLDFLVAFKKGVPPKKMGANMLALVDELELLFGRKVDLLRDRPLKNPYFAKSVEATKTLLYAA